MEVLVWKLEVFGFSVEVGSFWEGGTLFKGISP